MMFMQVALVVLVVILVAIMIGLIMPQVVDAANLSPARPNSLPEFSRD